MIPVGSTGRPWKGRYALADLETRSSRAAEGQAL